jgi:hypothetical protein
MNLKMQQIETIATYSDYFINTNELTVFITSELLLNPTIKSIFKGHVKQTCKNYTYINYLTNTVEKLGTAFFLKTIKNNDYQIHIYDLGNQLYSQDGCGNSLDWVTPYRGINFTAYDMGSLSGVTNGLPGVSNGVCTDINNSTGGWLQYENRQDTLTALSKATDAAAPYIVGGAGLSYYNHWFQKDKEEIIDNPPWNLGAATSPPTKPDSNFSTSFPDPNQINAAIEAGVNIFRLPFMPTFIKALTVGWAQHAVVDNDTILYTPPNENYFKWYMETIDLILQKTVNGQKPVVIIDCHVYQRWCPINIPGTQSCLPANSTTQKMYDMLNDDCPYDPDNTNQDKGPTLDAINQCAQDLHPKYVPPDNFRKIIGIQCMNTLWKRLLALPTDLAADKPQSFQAYIKSSDNIWIDLMNEPSMVYTEDLGLAYAGVLNLFIDNKITNRILIEGNYWSGMHAQMIPGEKIRNGITTPDSSSQGAERDDTKSAPAEVLFTTIQANVTNWQTIKPQLVFNLHQYMDYNSTGLWGCTDSNKINNTSDITYFTNFDLIESWSKQSGIPIFVSELGAVLEYDGNNASTQCGERLNLFLKVLEQSPQVIGWTLWRAIPTINWAFLSAPVDPDPDKKNKDLNTDLHTVKSWSNGIYWATPEGESFIPNYSNNTWSKRFTAQTPTTNIDSGSGNIDSGGLWQLNLNSNTSAKSFYSPLK